MIDDDEIRAVVKRLSRRHSSGGEVIERAAIFAEGANSAAIVAWIMAHDGAPEAQVAAGSERGLHGERVSARRGFGDSAPRRYVLPPGVLL